MAKLLKLRRGTTSQHSSFTGAEGEVTVDTTKDTLVVHDGSTAGGTPLAKEAGTIAEATNVTVTANNSANETVYPVFVDGATGTQGIESDTGLTYNPSSGDLTISGELDAATGDFSGNVDIDGDIDIDGTCEADAYTVNGTALDAYIANITSSASGTSEHVTVTDNENTNENNLITFVENAASTTGSHGLEMDGDFHYNPSTGLLSVPGVSTSGNITIAGNLTVNGTTTTVSTTNTTITDNLLELNSGASSNANDCGILIERGSTGDNAIIAWDESNDTFKVGTTTSTNSATGDLTISTGTLVSNIIGNVTGDVTGDLTGNVTGNVTGNTSGSSGSCTGNAVSADTVDVSNTSTDATYYPTFTDNNGSGKTIYIDNGTGLTFNPSSNVLTAGSFTGNLTGNVTGDVTGDVTGNTSGSSGSCTGNAATATAATNVTVSNQGSDTTCFPLFTTAATGDLAARSNASLTFNASTANLSATTFTGNLTGNVTGNTSGSSGSCTGNAAGLTGSPNITVGTIGCGAITGTSTISDSKGNVRNIPQSAQSSSYTCVAADAGKHVYATMSSGSNVTLPASVFVAGDAVTIINNSANTLSVVSGSGLTLYNTADAATGNRTLAARGMATVLYVGATGAYISGSGLS